MVIQICSQTELEPVAQLRGDAAGLAEEERVDDLPAGEQLPAADHHDQGRDPRRVHE
jgi:hypothetical protein